MKFLFGKNSLFPHRISLATYKATTCPVRTDSSQAKAMRRLFTASAMWSVRSVFSRIAFRK